MSNAAPIVQKLVTDRAAAKQNEAGWKAETKRIDGELAEIIKPEDHIKAAKKDSTGGSTTVTEYGAKFTVEAEKKVDWDSDMLQNIAAGLPWPQVAYLFKIKFEMKEARFKDVEANVKAGNYDPALFEKIKEARTVTIGEAKIKTAELIS